MLSEFYTLQQLFKTAQMNPQKIAVILDDQMWTYSELIEQIERVVNHLYQLNIVQGQIIYQFVERSFEMICGLFGIMFIGGVYCPLNPTDPHERIVSLLKQTQGQYVLLHEKTRSQFPCTAVEHLVLLDKILVPSSCNKDLIELPDYVEYGPAIIVCTSGTTGRSKVIVHTHKSFSASINTYVQWDLELYTYQNQILQVATSSWILHITEISLPLVVGGTLVLLRPNGHLDMSYFAQILIRQQITTLTIGTSIIRALTNYLQMNEQLKTFTFVRKLCLTGESMKAQQLTTLINFSSLFNTQICTQYGMSECNSVLGCELRDIDDIVLPIGYPLPGIQCLLIDDQGQILNRINNTNEIGQIHIGGSTLFNCYLNDSKRTSTAFTVIEDQIYIKTGDLARYNERGELVHVGRIDFQIKIRGQRVETAEIENTIIKFSPNKIFNCLVTKISQNDDYLIAYIISNHSDLDTELIRDYCNKHLCQYMVPFHIMILDKFPLNANGKIDRKQLPLPALLSKESFTVDDNESISTIQEKIHNLWCSILRLDYIPYDMNCFALGGSSLSLMQLFNYYQFHFTSDKQLKILDFFLNPTITGHVQLLLNSKIKTKNIWYPLHLSQGVASLAQQRLWVDEQVRFDTSIKKQTSVYNEILIYKLKSTTSLSINNFRQALQLIVTKHTVLRTALIYEHDKLVQKILPISDDSYDFQATHVANDSQLKKILYDEETNPSLFNLEQGRVFRCHVLHCSSDNEHETDLKQNDIVIFNFHHIAIDGSSIPIFIKDLRQALTTEELIFNNEVDITYLDYTQYERLEDWSNAREYWSNALTNFNNSIHQQNPSIRTGKGYTITFDLDHDIIIKLNQLITQSNLTLFQIGLAVLFIFLFKMSNSDQLDLCIGIIAANRSQYQLENMIGFFANTVPFCVKIDPYESFTELCHRIQKIWYDILPHLHLPYQEIIKLNSKIGSSFVRTLFQVETIIDMNEQNIKLNEDTTLDIIHRNLLTDNIAKFDMACALYENRQNKTISVSINASLDLYDKSTITTMSNRFKIIFNQLFSTSSICKISLLLPHELELMYDLNNNFYDHDQINCIHHTFVNQAIRHPQKLAVELDDQSLTYAELLYYAQLLSLHLLNYHSVIPGEIICQCVERSISMVIGIMGIEMSGCVYCPLSPRDPEHRLHSLIQQTQSRIILVHGLTKTMFNDNLVTLDIDELVINNIEWSDIEVEQLSSIAVTPDNIAYIIFTSGSTSTPKAVQVRHRNFTNFMHSLVHTDIFNQNDIVLQMAACTFDVHIHEIIGTLMLNATIIMLRPHGNMDFMYLAQILQNKQITYLQSVPTLLNSFYNFIKNMVDFRLTTLRSLCCGGEPVLHKTIDSFRHIIGKNCRVWNLYGPAEATIVSTLYQINIMSTETKIPIGRPLINYKCMLVDEFLQPVMIDREGELLVGGPCVFAGYIGNDDLTTKALINIDGELFYRTGDLVKMDNNGLLHYLGRKDHQIKLHGQRIELGEIEQCLLDTSISACVVMKLDEDHLIAYVESSSIDDKQLREHCQFHLPPHMIPSIFIVVEQLPLNSNGKVDRKSLPPFDLTLLKDRGVLVTPRNKTEVTIHHIWCNLFQQNQISIDANIFSIGGHSLLLMQLFHRYKFEFHLETNTLSIADLFQHPTIIGHAQLIHQCVNITQTYNNSPWFPLYLTQARASFAQERVFLDEQIRFASKTNNNTYAIPLLYRISSDNHHVSITRLYHAFQAVIRRHPILHTALYLDTHGAVIQHCIDVKSDELSVINLRDHDHNIDKTINEILNQPDLFDISKGRVIRCHILRSYHFEDSLIKDDLILINIHHAFFDGASVPLFLRDLSLAYNSNYSLSIDDNALQYIDYSIHERRLNMTLSKHFWQSQLQNYNFNQSLLLPVDRRRSPSHQRSGLTHTTQFIFNNHISTAFINYASSHNITLFQLGLAVFYTFLFKLNHHQPDICVTALNANRYKVELQDMIGMFVSTLPYRIQLHSQWSFDELVKHVQQQCLAILEHSHYPLQHILSDFHVNQSNPAFLETLFDLIIVSRENENICFDGTSLEQISLEQSYEVAKFDFSLTFIYDRKLDNDELSCRFVGSRDVFDETTVTQMAKRFQYICEQLFSTSNRTEMNEPITLINQLTVILPEEAEEIEIVVFNRLENIDNEAPASYAQTRIWLDEQIRFDREKSSIGIYNMPFLCRLSPNHTLSIKQLRHALELVMIKHPSLRTSLVFDTEKNTLMQRIIDSNNDNNNHEFFTVVESIVETEEQLNDILHDERRNCQHFDLNRGLVFRCHIIHHNQTFTNDLLNENDAIIFNFHHALFDFISFNLFLTDLNQAYITNQLSNLHNTTLRYLDYAVIEQQMLMNGASLFWLDILHGCNLDQSLSLPYDRYRQPNEHRTGRGTSVSFNFGQNLSRNFLTYVSSNNIKAIDLAVAIYYVFLFKLTNGENDICIGMNTNGRYRNELESVIGMFVNAIPLRCQLNPYWSFHQLVKHVQEIVKDSLKYSYYPLQHILSQHSRSVKPVFLDTSFEFHEIKEKLQSDDQVLVAVAYPIDISANEVTSKFDFTLTIEHDLNINQLSCTINASLDLFDVVTIQTIMQRFHLILEQLFKSTNDQMEKPIYELSLILPNERTLMKSLNNTQISLPSLSSITHEFVNQAIRHPQKLAVELDDQSLTYSELLYYVQLLSLHLLNYHSVIPGEIICQCVERSISMVIGIMSIEMSGCVYCPLSPHDPEQRLRSLIQQTGSRIILVHNLTSHVLNQDICTLDIDSILNNKFLHSNVNIDRLHTINMLPSNVAYIIFTSGSTGIPKAAQIRHRNFIEFTHSLVHVDLFNHKDIIVQMASCSYDSHLQEIMGSLISGSSIVMLRPQGNMDFEYLSTVLYQKQISYIQSVPAYMRNIIDFFLKQNYPRPETLRTIDLGGDISTVQLIEKVYNYFSRETRIWNCYGPAETTIACISHLVDMTVDKTNIPIGRPLPNYKCMLMDEFLQPVITGQEGELFVGGVGVFAGYLGNDDLTTKALINIDGELFYRTGDLVKMDNNGLLHYLGRKDHQIKLHGQRIELGEIEQCLLDTSISACVVMKLDEDHLIAYVESSSIDDKQLREHCQFHLPPHMIPSIFIVVEQLPLNSNGKVDRKSLPSPDLPLSSSAESSFPNDQLIKSVLDVWCQVLQRDEKHMSTKTSFFSIGGHSLLFIELYHRYQSLFGFDNNILSIASFLQQPTIIQHASLLKTIIVDDHQSNQWYTLDINQGIASFAQERIFLDEQIRFFNKISIYNELIVLRPVRGSLSKDRLSQALRCVMNKHRVLRTSLIFNHEQGILNQYINDDYQTSTLINKQTLEDERELHDIIYKTTINPTLFDLASGRVFYCQVLHQQQTADENNDTDLITERDVLIFGFHHAAFDRTSTQIFLNSLSNSYNNKVLISTNEQSLRYIDYSIHERRLDMTLSKHFWQSQLKNYNFNQPLLLPVDRHRSPSHQRSGLTHTTQFIFNNHISTAFINYASSHNITLFQLGLAVFYAFLFKLNHHQNDICITSLNANRYKVELQDMIGMFVSTLPYRIQLHSQWSFDELVKHVQEQCLAILEHSHYPLQHILTDFHVNQSNPAFLETLFDLIIVSKENENICFDGISLEQISLEQSYEVAKFDFSLTFVYDRKLDNDELSCRFVCSRDVFDEITVTEISQRFHLILEQLFKSTNDQMEKPIYELSLILPNERTFMKSLNNTQISLPPLGCAPHEFVNQVINHPQKLAVELDDQSLTYSELLYYVQLLSLHLLNYHSVIPGEIICQCVERSIPMVIGIMGIEMSGCVYCPLSPHDPEHRLHSLIQQTQSRIVFVNQLTKTKFPDGLLTIDLSLIITSNDTTTAIDIDPLSDVMITPNDIAYMIFTSGSTGIPKAAQIRHRNMIQCIHSLVSINAVNENDTVIQVARCSFDVHVLDIMGTLIIGGTVVMLHSEGILDFYYFSSVLQKKQITYIQAVPTFLHAFFSFLSETHQFTDVSYLKTLCSSGEQCTVKLIDLLISCVGEKCNIWNLYGPAETIICTYHRVDPIRNGKTIPIGLSMPNYRCLILDEFLQPVITGQEGELFVGGVGVFAGYLGNDDLTMKSLINIDGELFYRTRDLVKMDSNGLLHYLGRKDHQIKLHGQRIELGEIEQCLLDTSISACVVMKLDENHLIAYVESSSIDDKQLREHCQLHLPPHMIPSIFIVVEQFPLNSNGKVDRKSLPVPQLLTPTYIDQTNLSLLTPLEQQLRRIFIEAFHNESPDINMSFGKMGGTSLDAIRALWLIRQEIYNKMDATILFTNPSIRQLAKIIEPLLLAQDKKSIEFNTVPFHEDQHRPMPSLYIELLGIVLLICQWLFPIWLVYESSSFITILLIPLFHLLSYIVCQRLMFQSEKISNKVDKLYSWDYYRWWFLNSMWSINNSYWLKHLIGTPFYNSYLRLCGAKIGNYSYIYTTLIDAPWLIEVGASTFIGEDVVFSSLFYQDQTYKLDQIRIGSYCSINTRCVLYGDTIMQDYSYVKPMSTITGNIQLSTDQITIEDRSLSFNQIIYQFTCLFCLFCIHIAILFEAYCVYYHCLTLLLPIPISLPLAWLVWILTSFFTVLCLLKFIVRFTKPGHYPVNSYYYLHKIWLRQLIITSFHHSLDFLPFFNVSTPIILRWLGAHIDDDVKLAEFRQILYFPSNLLHIQFGVTTFGGLKLAPCQITKHGVCSLDEIHIGADVNLGNWCTVMPDTRLPFKVFVSSLSLVTRKTISHHANSVLLGIPAREMPFTMPDNISTVNNLSSSSSFLSMLITCISFFMSKCTIITLYSFFPVSTASFIYVILFCAVYRCSMLFTKKHTRFTLITYIQEYFHILTTDFSIFIGSYLSGTQFLVFLFRILGAHIGIDVILPNIHCLTDPHLTTIGNHVRLNTGAYIQCHTFEQHVFKLAPITIGHSSIIMSNSLILSGSILKGHNHIFPWTLIMKDDRLNYHTKWSGVPAQQII